MVDFGSEQGLSDLETAGIVAYCEDFKRAKTPLGAKRCHLGMDTNQAQTAQAASTVATDLGITGPRTRPPSGVM